MKKELLLLLGLISISAITSAQPVAWQPRGIGGGGALFSPGINPADDNEFYLACDMSALYHTTDFGSSYEIVNSRQLQGGIYSQMRFTDNPNILYCIGHTPDYYDRIPVRGSDGGITWSILPGVPFTDEDVFSLYTNFNNPEQVLISYWNGIYFSDNGGDTFILIHTAQEYDNTLVSGVFFEGDNIFVGTNDGLLISTSGGAAFEVEDIAGIPGDEVMCSFVGAKENSTTRFFAVTGSPDDIFVGFESTITSEYAYMMQGVYSLDYGQGAWTSVMNGITPGTDFLIFVDMAENDIDTAYLAGSVDPTRYPNIMKTTNGGGNWTPAFLTENNQNIATGWSGYGGDRGWGYGEVALGLTVAADNSAKVAFSDMGFIHTTSDGGSTWRQHLAASLS
ncbi:MAG: hypothetical protein GY869_19945 [Planctomycetes bacterium]|nr:hypothetical protein [Planctomycetota bacterium]